MKGLSGILKIDTGSLAEFSDEFGNVAIFDRSINKILYYGFCEEFIDQRTRQELIEDNDDNYLIKTFSWNANSERGHVILNQAVTEMRVPRTRTLRRYGFHRIELEPEVINDLDQDVAQELAAYQAAAALVV